PLGIRGKGSYEFELQFRGKVLPCLSVGVCRDRSGSRPGHFRNHRRHHSGSIGSTGAGRKSDRHEYRSKSGCANHHDGPDRHLFRPDYSHRELQHQGRSQRVSDSDTFGYRPERARRFENQYLSRSRADDSDRGCARDRHARGNRDQRQRHDDYRHAGAGTFDCHAQLVGLMPGVTANSTDELYLGVSAPAGTAATLPFSINGNRNSANNWTIDGADNVDRGGNLTLLNFPSIDAISEFKVERSLYTADSGRAGGGQVTVATRSGTSQFHGSAYEFNRNDAYAANNWINNANKVNVVNGKAQVPPLRWND